MQQAVSHHHRNTQTAGPGSNSQTTWLQQQPAQQQPTTTSAITDGLPATYRVIPPTAIHCLLPLAARILDRLWANARAVRYCNVRPSVQPVPRSPLLHRCCTAPGDTRAETPTGIGSLASPNLTLILLLNTSTTEGPLHTLAYPYSGSTGAVTLQGSWLHTDWTVDSKRLLGGLNFSRNCLQFALLEDIAKLAADGESDKYRSDVHRGFDEVVVVVVVKRH
jgi:hypothetical protein